MNKYFQFDYHGKFHLFSEVHLLTLILIALLGVCVFVFRHSMRRRDDGRGIRWFLIFLLLASEIGVELWYLLNGKWSVRYSLPLEVSDITVLLAVVMLWTKNLNLFKIMYFAGIGSSIQALLTPDLGRYNFPHFRYIEFFAAHSAVLFACLFMVAVDRYRPTIRSLWVTVLLINVYGGIMYLFDRLVDANYLFLVKKPAGTSILNILGPWPWYLLLMEALVIVSSFILYVPFWMYYKVKKGRDGQDLGIK